MLSVKKTRGICLNQSSKAKPSLELGYQLLTINYEGEHYYLYVIMDIFSRKIVGAEVFQQELGEHAADLLQRTTWKEKCVNKGIVLTLIMVLL